MGRFIDTDRRVEEMVMGVVWVLESDGVPGLTLRRIARACASSPSSLLQRFETRERMLHIAAHRTGRALIAAAESDALYVGLTAFLPVDEVTRALTSAWMSWIDLARTQPWLELTVSELRSRERDALAQVHETQVYGQSLSESELDTLVALLDGLRQAVCASVDPMPLERARDLLMSASGGGVVTDAAAPDESGDRQGQQGDDR